MKLQEKQYYHIYHRGIDRRKLFEQDWDLRQFLKKYWYYLYLSVETYAYCLLGNHVHILIRVRTENQQKNLFECLKSKVPFDSVFGLDHNDFKFLSASFQFGHLFNSYTKYFNKKYERSGVLFDGRFKRKKIEDENYMNQLVCYIHRNPIHHGIKINYSGYPFSSYDLLLSKEKSFIERKKVLQLFGDRENFIIAHEDFKRKLDVPTFQGSRKGPGNA